MHEAGIRSCILPQSNRKAKIRWNRRMYRERNRIERMLGPRFRSLVPRLWQANTVTAVTIPSQVWPGLVLLSPYSTILLLIARPTTAPAV